MIIFHLSFKPWLLFLMNFNHDFTLCMPLFKVSKGIFCVCKRENFVDYRLDLSCFYKFAELVKLIAIRTNKEK